MGTTASPVTRSPHTYLSILTTRFRVNKKSCSSKSHDERSRGIDCWLGARSCPIIFWPPSNLIRPSHEPTKTTNRHGKTVQDPRRRNLEEQSREDCKAHCRFSWVLVVHLAGFGTCFSIACWRSSCNLGILPYCNHGLFTICYLGQDIPVQLFSFMLLSRDCTDPSSSNISVILERRALYFNLRLDRRSASQGL